MENSIESGIYPEREKVKMIMTKERVSEEEAEKIITEYTEEYISDGFSESEARSMAIAAFDYDYERF